MSLPGGSIPPTYTPPPPSTQPTVAPGGKRTYVNTQAGPVFLTGNQQDISAEEAQQIAAGFDRAIQVQTQLLQQTAGLERQQIEAKIQDLVEGRKNALEIARLQTGASTYGTDAQTAQSIRDLSEKQRQFNATHSLDLQKFGLDQSRFGLDLANGYVKYASSPDMRWSANDFDTAVRNIGVGGGPAPISGQPQPQAKSWQDWAALTGYQTPAIQAGQTQASGGGQANMAMQGAGGGGEQKDPRLAAATGILKALPPSGEPGHDDNDWAALNAIRNLYMSGRPGDVEKLGPARRKIAQAGLARMGYDPYLVESDRQRSLPHQGRASAA